MNESELNTALHNLAAEWGAQAKKAEQQGRQLSVGNIQQSFYQRGLAEGLRQAQASLQNLLTPPQVETPPPPAQPEVFTPVNREAVLAALIRSGVKIHELHPHNDNSYSVIMPTLQSLSYDENLDQLAALPNVVILAHGRLPNSSKAYIDFAFRKPSRA